MHSREIREILTVPSSKEECDRYFQRGRGVWAPAARKFSATRLYLADDDRDIGVFHWHSTGVLEFGTILECLAWHFS